MKINKEECFRKLNQTRTYKCRGINELDRFATHKWFLTNDKASNFQEWGLAIIIDPSSLIGILFYRPAKLSSLA